MFARARMVLPSSSASFSVSFNAFCRAVVLPYVTGRFAVGSMLIGQAGFDRIVVQVLLQMSCMLCMSVLFYSHSGSSMLLYLHLRQTL